MEIISDIVDAAADHENTLADVVILCERPGVDESELEPKVIPNRLCPVASPWLAETEMDMVIVAVKATISKNLPKGGLFNKLDIDVVILQLLHIINQ
jgi:hypothetical protein